MKIVTYILLTTIAVFLAFEARSQTAGKVENFSLSDVTSNRPVSLADYKDSKGVVLVFTSNSCPYAKLYDARIISLAKEFSGKGIQFLLINSNTSSDDNSDSAEQMAAAARQKGYVFPYLTDKDQKVAKMFGATKNPEVFVLQNNGDIFTIKYRGAIDDNPQMPNDVTAQYLRDAIQSVLNKQNLSVVDRRATGCVIRKD